MNDEKIVSAQDDIGKPRARVIKKKLLVFRTII